MPSSNSPSYDALNKKLYHLAQQNNPRENQIRDYFNQLTYIDDFLDLLLENTYKEKRQVMSALDRILTNLKNIYRDSTSATTREEVLYHINFLGNKYETSSFYQRAASCYEFSATQNDPVGLFNSGRFYYHGLGGCPQSLTKAHELITASNVSPEFASYLDRQIKDQKPSVLNRITASVGGAILGPILGAFCGFGIMLAIMAGAPLFASFLPAFSIGMAYIGAVVIGSCALIGLVAGIGIGITKGWGGFADLFSSSDKKQPEYSEYINRMLPAKRPQLDSSTQLSTKAIFTAANVKSVNEETYASKSNAERQLTRSPSTALIHANTVPEFKTAKPR